jgi:O-antigen ligase
MIARWALIRLLPSLAFLLTALIGIWAAYDRMVAQEKFVLLCAGIALAHTIEWLGWRYAKAVLGIVGLGCTASAGALGTIVLLTRPGHADVVASMLVLLLPLGVCAIVWAYAYQYWPVVMVASFALAIALVALLFTWERSAWLALTVGVVSGAIIWRSTSNNIQMEGFDRRWFFVIGTILACLAVVMFLVLRTTPRWLVIAEMIGSTWSRLYLWRDSLVLIQDYFFTGSGLGMMAMVYSSYVLLQNVPYHYHVHNLFLQIAIEQGVPGLLAFLAMIAVSSWSLVKVAHNLHGVQRMLWFVTVVTWVTFLFHGLLDFELYASKFVPLLFLPFGISGAFAGLQTAPKPAYAQGVQAPGRRLLVTIVTGVALIAAASFLMTRSFAQAAFQANLGAVAQTRAELSVYHWPEWAIQDQVRRNGMVSLAPAISRYDRALTLDPGSVTAHRRLGQIALSLGDYAAAQYHLEAAYAHAPQQRATRQLLGEVYAINGEPEEAARLWQSIDNIHGQLEVRRWWYQYIGAEQELERISSILSVRAPTGY